MKCSATTCTAFCSRPCPLAPLDLLLRVARPGGGRVVGDWTTAGRIDRTARELNGQKLLDVRVNPRGARTRFVFALGAELETKPYDRSSEQWLLYEQDGHVLTWRADGKYKYGQGNRPPGHFEWHSLPG